jgi:hypothetical protein
MKNIVWNTTNPNLELWTMRIKIAAFLWTIIWLMKFNNKNVLKQCLNWVTLAFHENSLIHDHEFQTCDILEEKLIELMEWIFWRNNPILKGGKHKMIFKVGSCIYWSRDY